MKTNESMKIKLLIALVLMPMMLFAKNYEKDFIKLIKAHDVPYAARGLSLTQPLDFYWSSVLDNNVTLKNLFTDMSKKKGAEKDAMNRVYRMSQFDYRNEVSIIDEMKGFCDTLVMDMGLPASMFNLNVIYDESPNAFTVLTPNGFDVCLNSGLLIMLDFNYYQIMGIVAHEFAHGAMMHHLRSEYEVQKKIRKDKILGGIATGLNAAAQITDAYTSAMTGNEYNPYAYEMEYLNIQEKMALSSLKFRYKYSREEELEADLYAFRFLERLGKGSEYQEALKIICSDARYFWHDDFDDHPATGYRIAFLDFVAEHPEYRLDVKLKGK